MLISYSLLRNPRSPKREQANLLDLKALVEAKCERIYVDFERGNRQQLQAALDSLEANDTLLVPSFNCLGNSQAFFLEIVVTLKKQEVALQSLSENYLLSPDTRLIDCLNLAKKLFPRKGETSLSASICREIKEKGRPPLPKEKKELMRLLKLLKINNKPIKICKLCKLAVVTRTTYYNLFPPTKVQKIAS